MRVYCFDGKERLAKIRGKFVRRVWVNIGDLILVQRRELSDKDDDKCDVIHVYYSDEVKKLKNLKEIPKDVKVANKVDNEKNDLDIQFEEEEKKVKVKKEKQNLDDFMPSMTSESEDGEDKDDVIKEEKEKDDK